MKLTTRDDIEFLASKFKTGITDKAADIILNNLPQVGFVKPLEGIGLGDSKVQATSLDFISSSKKHRDEVDIINEIAMYLCGQFQVVDVCEFHLEQARHIMKIVTAE
jgi:hypothetical protein